MRKNGWIIYNETDAIANRTYIDWFIEECSKQEMKLELVVREQLSIGISSNQPAIYIQGKQAILPDFAVVRTVEPILNSHLEQLGIAVFNAAEVSRICNDKALTHQHVANLGVPMVDMTFLPPGLMTKESVPAFPVVVKATGGRGGSQVYLVENQADWDNTFHKLHMKPVVIQSCDVDMGKDLRVFVIGKEIMGAVLRENDQDFRANYKLGGKATLFELSNSQRKLIMKIVHSFNFGMAGIDFLFSKSGDLLFNEIEDVVGSRTLSKVSSVNLLEHYTAFIKKQLS